MTELLTAIRAAEASTSRSLQMMRRPEDNAVSNSGAAFYVIVALNLALHSAAQAIEAQRAETAKTGSVGDESAVASGDAPKGGGSEPQPQARAA